MQQFKTKRAERLPVRIGGAPPRTVGTDADGHITITDILIPSKEGIRIHIERP